MPIAWSTVENALRAWLIAGSGLSAVYFADQDGPQPAEPFATIKVTGPRKLGGLDVQVDSTNLSAPAGTEVTSTLYGQREITVSCQVFAKPNTGANTAKDYLSSAITSLELPSIRQNLINAGLSCIDAGDITDVSALLETRWQSRAAADVRFGLVDTAAESNGYIATVEVTDELTQ